MQLPRKTFLFLVPDLIFSSSARPLCRLQLYFVERLCGRSCLAKRGAPTALREKCGNESDEAVCAATQEASTADRTLRPRCTMSSPSHPG